VLLLVARWPAHVGLRTVLVSTGVSSSDSGSASLFCRSS
jgi:hypothetical protein